MINGDTVLCDLCLNQRKNRTCKILLEDIVWTTFGCGMFRYNHFRAPLINADVIERLYRMAFTQGYTIERTRKILVNTDVSDSENMEVSQE